MICRTPEEAFAAGLAERCDHGTAPAECPACQLTDLEISRLVVLHRECNRSELRTRARAARAA